jgi:SMC interacting uncharacterized protein involved in chromosome segregation
MTEVKANEKKFLRFAILFGVVLVFSIGSFFLGNYRNRSISSGVIRELQEVNAELAISLGQAKKQSINLEGQLEGSRREAEELRGSLEGIADALTGASGAVGASIENLDDIERILEEIGSRLEEIGIFD